MVRRYRVEEKSYTSDPNKVLGQISRQEGMRPRKGMQLCIKGILYTIVETDPKNNPDNDFVTYIVERFNPNAPFKPGINPRDARGPKHTKL